MSLKVYNTLTREKDDFIPLEKDNVKMYVCGITVYDSSHVGHARAAVVFDMIYRYLTYKGFNVIYVRNFTDVDDKIIARAQKENQSCEEIAQRYIDEYITDMKQLNVCTPSYEPKATEHITHMQDVISSLISKGHAYAADGDVFFSVASFPNYGKLSGRSLDEMMAGARINIDKRKTNPHDFVLWKASKPGEPAWDSPWGKGRPGWHIECTAMSMEYLGQTIDIHGGGQDLVFPHHENEVAQSEACSGKPFVKYWMHNGFVTINKEKMSKSLGNFFVLHDLFTEWHPRILRYFLLSKQYRSPVDFNEDALKESKTALERIENALALFEQHHGAVGTIDEKVIKKHLTDFETAMDDDFNTPVALAAIFQVVNELNDALSHNKQPEDCAPLYFSIKKMLEILGIIPETKELLHRILLKDKQYDEKKAAEKIDDLIKDISANKNLSKNIEELIHIRNWARKTKNWAIADEIRNKLSESGILLRDEKEATIWERK